MQRADSAGRIASARRRQTSVGDRAPDKRVVVNRRMRLLEFIRAFHVASKQDVRWPNFQSEHRPAMASCHCTEDGDRAQRQKYPM